MAFFVNADSVVDTENAPEDFSVKNLSVQDSGLSVEFWRDASAAFLEKAAVADDPLFSGSSKELKIFTTPFSEGGSYALIDDLRGSLSQGGGPA